METGSSASRYAGSSTRALAMLTRWRCPPDSVWGYLCANSGGGERRTRSRAARASASRSERERGPWITSGSSTSSRTLM